MCLLQLPAILVFLLSGFSTICSLVARPRAEAQKLIQEAIPLEWDRVILHHAKAYRWPHRGPIVILFARELVTFPGRLWILDSRF